MKRAFVLGFFVVYGAACGSHGQMRVDSPATPYVAPDISDITGIDDDDSGDDAGSAAATPAPAPAAGPAPAAKPAGK